MEKIERDQVEYVISLLEKNKERALEKISNAHIFADQQIEFYKGQENAFNHAIVLLETLINMEVKF